MFVLKLAKVIPNSLKNFIKEKLVDMYSSKSYSQEGEDMILRRIFETKGKGFYVDVGAHHPKRFSNTYYFYKKGWNGINIDPLPGTKVLFDRVRPRDINVEMGVSLSPNNITYYMFDDPALNSFSEELSLDRDKNTNYKIINKKIIQTNKLSSILEAHLPKGITIDFISIDAEGFDLEVLKSNDWEKFRSKMILVEILGTDLNSVHKSVIHQFLTSIEYKLLAKTFNTFFYIDNKNFMEK